MPNPGFHPGYERDAGEIMRSLIATWMFALASTAVLAQDNATPAAAPRFDPPASVAAAPVPDPNDDNATRAKTQPRNNAPFWREVHDPGTKPGISNLPGAGHLLFGWLTYALKTAHNFVGPLFAVSLVIVFITFVRDNFPRQGDLAWLLKIGDTLRGKEVPSHRFNAGEKVVFWAGVFLLGVTVVASGLVMDKLVPGLDYLRSDMQVAHMVHAVAAVLMIVVFLTHIYIGTIGMRGALSAMKEGYVDDEWAAEHHELWYQDIRDGKIPAQRTPEPQPAPHAIQP